AESRRRAALEGLFQICGRNNAAGILAAHFRNARARAPLAKMPQHFKAHFAGTGKDHAIQVFVLDEFLAGFASCAGHIVENADRLSGAMENLVESKSGESRITRWFENNRVAPYQGRSAHARGEGEREVERRDDREDAM